MSDIKQKSHENNKKCRNISLKDIGILKIDEGTISEGHNISEGDFLAYYVNCCNLEFNRFSSLASLFR